MSEILHLVQAAVGNAYRLEREIEGGGMSQVFLATESSLNRQVVIKLLPPDHASVVNAARFKQEIEIAANLLHPHIVPVLGAGAQGELLYYVMPYVAGESLRKRMSREGAFPVPDAVRLLAEVADALAFAHGKGVIHRDIKPENILLQGNHAVLADFGIARALIRAQTPHRLTGTGMAVGTPGYMAPEQVVGESLDGRADVYSLAVVGYEMLSGAPPFAGSSAQAVLTAHLITPPLPLHELRGEVPIVLSAIIQKALSKVPEERFATAAEFAEALNLSMIHALEPGGDPDGRGRKRRQRLWAIAAILVTLLTAGWATHLVQARGRAHDLLYRLAPLVAEGDLDGVSEALAQAKLGLRNPALSAILPQVAGHLSVNSIPGAVDVTLTRVSPIATFDDRPSEPLGRTPIRYQPVVGGEYLLEFSSREVQMLSTLITVNVGDSLSVDANLPTSENHQAGFLPVPAGAADYGTMVQAFLVGQTEVTNEEYAHFVEAGGYAELSLWPEEMSVGGVVLDREEALTRFVDRTGIPGPRTWSGGRPPEGTLRQPVTGVSWYEANAYARWFGGQLPSRSQWYRAALGDGSMPYPWGMDGSSVELRANFGLSGPQAVGRYPLGVSPFGVQDMAGNVREWLADEVSGSVRRSVAGGSWRDPAYMFEAGHIEAFDPGTGDATIGFRVVRLMREQNK
jgi:eukaryotic-like serine/threonine-protein kinase